jgi:integrase
MAKEYKTKTLKNGEKRYEFDVNLGYDLNGKRIRKTVTSKSIKDGRAKVSELRLNYKQLSDRTLTFEEAYELYIKEVTNKVQNQELSFNTLLLKKSNYKKYSLFYKVKLDNITDSDVSLWQNGITGLNDQSKNKLEADLCTFFWWCVKKKLKADNPFKYIDKTKYRKKEITILTEKEFKEFLTVVDNEEFKLLLTTLFYTGLRFSEAMGLKNSDVIDNELHLSETRITERLISSNKFKTPNSKRIVPIPNWLEFPTKENYRCSLYNSITGYRLMLYRYINKADIRKFTFHDLRHSYVSMLIDKGVDIFLISRLVGHTDIKMTINRYGHLYKESRQGITDLFSIGSEKE